MPLFFIDKWYLILVVPALIVTFWAQIKVQTTFKKYNQIGTRGGLTGAEASAAIQRLSLIHISIVSPESAPIKRIIQDAKDRGTLIDATYGRRTRAVLVTDSDHVILSAVQPETVANRLNDREEEDEEELEDDE